MQSFKQYITESLSSPYEYTKNETGSLKGGRVDIIADVKSRVPLEISIKGESMGEYVLWDIFFSVAGRVDKLNINSNEHTMRTFATIKKLMQDEVKPMLTKGDKITFSAERSESSRVNLYDRFAKLVANEVKGTVNTSPPSGSKYKIYTITVG